MYKHNPNKFFLFGDKKIASKYKGQAASQMNILKNQMSFQELKQGMRRVWLNSTTFVECLKSFDIQVCKIWAQQPILIMAQEEEMIEGIIIKPRFNGYLAIKGRQIVQLSNGGNFSETDVYGAKNYAPNPFLESCCWFIGSDYTALGEIKEDTEFKVCLKGGVYSVLYYYDEMNYVTYIDQEIYIKISDAQIITIDEKKYYYFEESVNFEDLFLIKYTPDFEDNSSGPFMGPETHFDPTFDAFSLEAYFNSTRTPYSSFVSLFRWEGLATAQVGYVIRSWPNDSWMPYSKYLNADNSNILADVIYDGIEKGKILYFPGVATCWNMPCDQFDLRNINCVDETCLIMAYGDSNIPYIWRNFYSVRNCRTYTTTFYPGFPNETVDTVITSDGNGGNPVYTEKTDYALIAHNTYKQVADSPWELYHIYSVSITFTAKKWLADDTWW